MGQSRTGLIAAEKKKKGSQTWREKGNVEGPNLAGGTLAGGSIFGKRKGGGAAKKKRKRLPGTLGRNRKKKRENRRWVAMQKDGLFPIREKKGKANSNRKKRTKRGAD